MYDYIFWVVYKDNINKNKGNWLSRSNASGVVFFAAIMHVFLIISICKKFSIANISLKYLTSHRELEWIIGLLLMALTFYYYSENRANGVLEKYSSNLRSKWANRLMVALLILLPLLCIIILNPGMKSGGH
jgi:hypothetical protein